MQNLILKKITGETVQFRKEKGNASCQDMEWVNVARFIKGENLQLYRMNKFWRSKVQVDDTFNKTAFGMVIVQWI